MSTVSCFWTTRRSIIATRCEEGTKDDNGKKLSVEKFLKNANKRDFNEEQQAALLDESNWTVREGIKLANLLACLYGSEWELDLEDLEDKNHKDT